MPPVIGDRVQLQQVLMNLIVNSIDAMKEVDGTRELVISSQRTENEQVLVSVHDTGVGLPQQQRSRPLMLSSPPAVTAPAWDFDQPLDRRITRRTPVGRRQPTARSKFCFTLPGNVEAQE